MKRYIPITDDLTSLKHEFISYIRNIYPDESSDPNSSDKRRFVQAFHWLGAYFSLVHSFSSLDTTFTELKLKPTGIAYFSINKNALFNHVFGDTLLFIPLMNTIGSKIVLFNVKENAILQNGNFYNKEDCIVAEECDLTDTSVLVNHRTCFTIQTTNDLLSDFLVLHFNPSLTDPIFK